jgi:RNA polymerase sigma-70 factor (ECF subfamily)
MDLRDPNQFSEAFDEHHRSVYGAAYRVVGDHALASDVVQDVFLRLWRRPEAFDPERADLGTYLRLIARSRAIDLIREGQSRGRATDRFKVVVAEEEPGDGALRPDVALEVGLERAAVREALEDLPDPQREALVLAYWGGLTAEQIARYAKIPLGTAKSRIRLGLARLRTDSGLTAVV